MEDMSMDDDGFDPVKHFFWTGRLDPNTATRTLEKAVELLRRGMPHGREGLLLFPPDPADAFGDYGHGWATAPAPSPFQPQTGLPVPTESPTVEPGPSYNPNIAKDTLPPSDGEQVGKEQFDSMDDMLQAAFDTMVRLSTGDEASEQEWFAYHLSAVVESARELGMSIQNVLDRVDQVYRQRAGLEGDE
jgi:hypothetical protein